MPVKTQIFPARAARSETLCGYQSSGVSSAKFSTVSFMPSRNRISAGKWIGVTEILQN
jgi:hypothetical protein